jgi:hypothetical protein
MSAAYEISSSLSQSPSTSEDELHMALASLNRSRLRPALPDEIGSSDVAPALRREAAYLEAERAVVHKRASGAPTDAAGFVAWFEALKELGPGQNDPLFPWLATRASRDEMRWFLAQEVAGEAGFDDLVALTQVRMPTRAKLELARNYWDEMGRGNEAGMHGPMLSRLAATLGIEETSCAIVWEARALGNLLAGLAANRHYAYHAIGALGVVELTAPGRAALVAQGLKRLRLDPVARRYYSLHATLDIRHSEAWDREVITPLVEGDPRVASAIAEGALMRLRAGARCFERYRRELGLA